MQNIHKLQSLSGSNACDDLDWSAEHCRRYNLFYGWNGSGKTTLSRIFHIVEHGVIPADAPSTLGFVIPTDAGFVRSTDLSSHGCSVRVFNEDFIKTNVAFESGSALPILIVGQENIQALNEIDALEKENDRLTAKEQALLRERPENAKLSDMLTSCARDVGEAFANTPLASGAYRARSYTRPQVEVRIRENDISEATLDTHILSQDDQDSRRAIIKSEKTPISATITPLPDITGIFREANALLSTSVQSVDLGLLATDRELREWTEIGLRLHTRRSAADCLFCSQTLPVSLLPALARLFTNEVADLRQKLKESLANISRVEGIRIDAPDSGQVYPSVASRFSATRATYKDSLDIVLESLANLHRTLQARVEGLPDAGVAQPEVLAPTVAITAARTAIADLNALITEHNSAVATAAENVAQAARSLECHMIAVRLKAGEYFSKRSTMSRIDGVLGPVRTRRDEIARDLTARRAALHDAGIALDRINQHLRQYFSGDDLYLELDSTNSSGGYVVKSRGRRADTLSEGEKSVLALVYFLVKLKEDGCDLEHTTIVIDDPVDSQDGPFLYRTFGLIRSQLEGAGQLFVFTHNFEFFNLMRDWILDRRTRDRANCYLIEMAKNNGHRTLRVRALPALLREHKNEYPYLFAKLHEFSEHGTGLEPPLVPNIGRKVLEYFAAFKWACRNSEGLSEIVRARFVVGADPVRQAAGESVLKFVNEYSHGTDFNRPITASVLEARPIAAAVTAFINIADSEHFVSLTNRH